MEAQTASPVDGDQTPLQRQVQPPNVLWLGQVVTSPFGEDPSIRTAVYAGDSASREWPVASSTKAHGLHNIKTLCQACGKIDVTKLREDKRDLLLEDWRDVARTAHRCRFCAMIAQLTRIPIPYDSKRDFLSTVTGWDVPQDEVIPLYLKSKAGRLHVVIPYPVIYEDVEISIGEWDVCSVDFVVGNQTYNTSKSSTLTGGRLADSALDVGPDSSPESTHGGLEARLPVELERIIKSACTMCVTDVLQRADRAAAEQTGNVTATILPDRVIEILDTADAAQPFQLRLRATGGEEYGFYTTLSHRWGGHSTLKTTKERLPGLLRGFQLGDLPRTFRDAVLVTQALGARYVWIDSLCIVQDDMRDWLEQSAQMGRIYTNSACTIAAHSASQCNEGFLWRSQVPPTLRIAPRQGGGPDFWVFLPDIDADLLYNRFIESEISRRAWVLQELTLSPRVLHFVENRLLWECAHEAAEIEEDEPLDTMATLFRGHRAVGDEDVHSLWRMLVERYTTYQMTKHGDKLVALAGVADAFRARMDQPSDQPYHCGVFEKDLEGALLWYASDAMVGERHLERAPSWSWASADGELHFVHLEQTEPPRSLIRVGRFQHTDYFADEATSVRVPARRGCRVILQAYIIPVAGMLRAARNTQLEDAPEYAPHWMATVQKRGAERTKRAWCIFDSRDDCPSLEAEFTRLLFLAVSGHEREGKVIGAWCLIVRLEEGDSVYRRVGLGYVRDPELEIYELQTVTLV